MRVKTVGRDKADKRARFEEVAARRTIRVIRDIQLLARCALRSSYEYGARDIDRIFGAIDDELLRARAAFTQKGGVNFSLQSDEHEDEEGTD